ncbi:MAG: hypothetical protein ACR2KH_08530 [Sphingomicrobium sp.]
MRAAIILPALLLGACQVTKDDANDSMTVEYNQDLAENTAADVSNKAQEIGGHIANDVERTGDKVQNKVGDVDVDVDVSRNAPANSN